LKKIILTVIEEDKQKLEKIYNEIKILDKVLPDIIEKVEEIVTKIIIKSNFIEDTDMEKKVKDVLEKNHTIKENLSTISKYIEINSEKISSIDKHIQKVKFLIKFFSLQMNLKNMKI
jgi:hypothetical protein